jgi:serine phosphatase RsbU (regulator of sigma subunit)
MAQHRPKPETAPGGRPFLALTLALVLSIGVAIVDGSLTSRALAPLGLLATIPLVVAAVSGTFGVVAAGCIAAVVLLLMADYDSALWSDDVIVLLAGLAVATGVATATAAARRRRTRRLHRIESVADVVQQTLLRPLPASVNDVAIAAHYASATRGAQVGGDIYDVQVTPYGLRLFLGDVRGKGLAALYLANAALGAFREWSHEASTLTELAARLDASVARSAEPEEFVAGVVVEVADNAVEIVNCGHLAPLLVRSGSVQALEPVVASLPLGLGASGNPQTVTFTAGDRLLLFTDGVSEARRRGRFFDVGRELAAACQDRGAADTVDRLHQRLVKFTRRRLDDDVAIVLIERERSAGADPLELFDGDPYDEAKVVAGRPVSGGLSLQV